MATIGNVYPYSSVYPGKFNVVPTASTIVVDEPAWDTDSDWGAANRRQVIKASDVLVNASSITIDFTAAAATAGLDIALAYIGEAAATGDAYDFASTPTQILFSGAASASLSIGETLTSDTVAYSVDSSKDLIISIGITNASAAKARAESPSTGNDMYYKAGASSDAGTVDVTGYTAINNFREFVGEILKIS